MDQTTPVEVYQVGASRQDAKLSQRTALRHSSAYGGDQAIDYVMNSIDLYASTTAAAEWKLERTDGTHLVRNKTKLTPPDNEVGPKDLYDLLDKPNPHMLYKELVSLLVIDLLLVGNAYWLKWLPNAEGKPLSLFRLAPAYVKVVPGAFGAKSYEYQPPGVREPMKLAAEDVIHFRRPNPHSAYYGMGVIQGGGRAYDLELAVTDQQAGYYEDKADPHLIVQSDRRVPRDVFNKLRTQLSARTRGRSGNMLVLEAGLKASTLSPNARDQLFDLISRMSRDRIYAQFRANPKLFGIMDETGGSDKVGDARREFDTYVIRPFMDGIQDVITDGLTSAWGIKHVIDYRYMLPMEELVKNVGTFAAIPGIKVREVRRLLGPLGIPESTGDPKIDEMLLNQPGQEMDANGQGGSADRNLPGEAGRPPKGSNTTALTRKSPTNKNSAVVSGKALMDAIEAHNERLMATDEEPVEAMDVLTTLERALSEAEVKALLNPDGSRATIGNQLPDEQRPQDSTLDARTAAVDSAAGYIETQLADAVRTLERGLLDHVEGKAFKPNNLRSRLRNSAAWKTFSEQVEGILMEGARRSISASVIQSGRTPDDVDYDAIAESVVKRPDGLRGIVRTLKEGVLKRVAGKLDSAEPTQAIVQAEVQTALREWRDGKAGVVGISEAVEAYNEGMLSVGELTGAAEVFVVEEDDAPDEGCQEANGQVWPIEKARQRRKEHPNCRRSFILLGEPATVEA